MKCSITGFSWCRLIFLLFLAMLILMAMVSCAPDTFMLNKYVQTPWVNVKMLNGIEKAEKVNQNSFQINENALVSMKVIESNQFRSKFDLKLLEGDEISFYLYQTEADFEENKGLKIKITTSNYSIEINGKEVCRADSIKLNKGELHKINFHQEANLFEFDFDCNKIYLEQVGIPSTEFIIVRTNSKSRAILQGINNEENYERNYFEPEFNKRTTFY